MSEKIFTTYTNLREAFDFYRENKIDICNKQIFSDRVTESRKKNSDYSMLESLAETLEKIKVIDQNGKYIL